jgi:WD40 repeat protein
MSASETKHRCPSCGASLPGGALNGICVACAWGGLEGEGTAPLAPDVLFAVDGHEVLAEIARGGGGIVYRARQLQPRREVALKMLPPVLLASRELQERFRLEAETVAALHHPSILPVFLVGEKDGLPFFTMQLATGGTLAERRDRYAGRWREIAALVMTLAEAVQHAHEHGVVHRDLKPGNVLFDAEDRCYVSDFGLAKFTAAEPSVTRSQAVMGTPAYLAPEVVLGGAGMATTTSDVYGLGAILYELLAGRAPFVGESIPELLRQVAGDSPRRPGELRRGVPRDLEVICLRCLDKDPARRLPGAAAVAADLRAWLEHRPIQSRPVGGGERLARWARRNPALATLSAVLGLALVMGGVTLERGNRQLRAALVEAEHSKQEGRERLQESLLAQARLLRTSGRRGQRHDTLDVLARAAALRPSAEVRHEVAAALALPDLRFERSLRAFFADELATVAFAPDFQTYLSATGQPDFALLSVSEGRVLRRYPGTSQVQPQSFSFSGDGRWFAAKFVDRRVEIWARDGDKPAWTLPARGTLAVAVALHPREPICAWADDEGAVQLRDLVRGESRRLVGPGVRVGRLQFSPDGTQLAVLRVDRLSVVETVAGKAAWTRDGSWGAVEPSWSSDGRWLAVVESSRGDIEVVAADSGRRVQVLSGGGAIPQLIAFVPGQARVAGVTRNALLRLWDVASGELRFQTGMPPRALAFSPDGRQMAGARRWLEIGLFNWEEEAVFRELRGERQSRERGDEIAVSPDGRWLASSSPREVRVWDLRQGEQVAAVPLTGADWSSVCFDPRAPRLIYSAMNRGVFARELKLGTDGDGARERLTLGEEQPIGANRDGRLLGFAENGADWYVDRVKIERVVVWPGGDPTREQPLAESRRNDRPTLSPDGKFVAAMGYPQVNVRVTAVGSGRAAMTLPLKQHAGAGFSRDGRWFVTGTETEYQTWELPTLQPGPRWPRSAEGGGFWGTPVFSRDGQWVGCDRGQGEVEVRDAREFGERVRLIPPVRVEFSSGVWSPDGGRFYVLGEGHRIFEWNFAALRRELAARGLDW